MKQKIERWVSRNFLVISNEKAVKWSLSHHRNVHGDEINSLNCRSLWKDSSDRIYRVKFLNP